MKTRQEIIDLFYLGFREDRDKAYDKYGQKHKDIILRLEEFAACLDYFIGEKITMDLSSEIEFIDSLGNLDYGDTDQKSISEIITYGEYLRGASVNVHRCGEFGKLEIDGVNEILKPNSWIGVLSVVGENGENMGEIKCEDMGLMNIVNLSIYPWAFAIGYNHVNLIKSNRCKKLWKQKK